MKLEDLTQEKLDRLTWALVGYANYDNWYVTETFPCIYEFDGVIHNELLIKSEWRGGYGAIQYHGAENAIEVLRSAGWPEEDLQMCELAKESQIAKAKQGETCYPHGPIPHTATLEGKI